MPYGWMPGDASVGGIALALGYLGSTLLCFVVAGHSIAPAGSGGHTFLLYRVRRQIWMGLGLLLMLLGIERQLDLVGLLIDLARQAALARGIYGGRRVVQKILVMTVAISGGIGLVATLYAARRLGGWIQIALAGGIGLLGLTFVRAISWHAVDAVFRRARHGIHLDHLADLLGIMVVAAGALGYMASLRTDSGKHRRRARRLRR